MPPLRPSQPCGNHPSAGKLRIRIQKMKNYLIAAAAAALTFAAVAEENKTAPAKIAPTPVTSNKSDAEIVKDASYAVGVNIGTSWKKQDIELNIDEVTKGLRDTLGGSAKMTEMQSQDAIQAWQQKRADFNKKKSEAYLAENGKKAGVKTTASGLQYEVLTEGTGKMPGTNDAVSVHYRGTLLSGQEFDSSYKRNQPAEFPVTGVIKGWTEALLLMKTGSKWKLTIPPGLAYGESGRPGIPPNSLLIFEVELLGIKGPPEEKVNAVSGEIIKVPSAEELKKGAKIEVLKEEDVKKLTNSAAKPQPKK
jgi:FKBP-type peptidyl-prolyl cis-trans isomerase